MYKTLVLSSVTYAHKAQSILSRAGIRSTIMRSAAVRAVKGCAYGLRLQAEQVDRAAELLGRAVDQRAGHRLTSGVCAYDLF